VLLTILLFIVTINKLFKEKGEKKMENKNELLNDLAVEEINFDDVAVMEEAVQPAGAVCGLGCPSAGAACGVACK
jgi:hypothetical protein